VLRDLEKAISANQIDLTIALLRVLASQAHLCDAHDCACCMIAPSPCNGWLDEATRMEIFNRVKTRMKNGRLISVSDECFEFFAEKGFFKAAV